jgi:hypothetical protein
VDWLNGEGSTKGFSTKGSRARVLEVISGIRELEERIDGDSGKRRGPFELAPEVQDAFAKLNRILKRYSFRKAFAPDRGHGRGWCLADPPLTHKFPLGERIAIYAVLELADENRLQTLKTCECGQWYFAKFSHQRFCSAECRVKFWENSEDRKGQKRQKAREYYWLHKKKNVK